MRLLLSMLYPIQTTLDGTVPLRLVYNLLEASTKYSFDVVISRILSHLEIRMTLDATRALTVYSIGCLFKLEDLTRKATLECMKHGLSSLLKGVGIEKSNVPPPLPGPGTSDDNDAKEIIRRISAAEMSLLIHRHCELTEFVRGHLEYSEDVTFDRCTQDEACSSWDHYIACARDQVVLSGPSCEEKIFSREFIESTIRAESEDGCGRDLLSFHHEDFDVIERHLKDGRPGIFNWKV
jgi:hypothetical protein